MTRRVAVIALASTLILAACFAATPSRADDYPSRPVRIVFGFGPGSSGDVMSRVLAQRMSQDLGQPFIVEGKPGANGQLGAAQVARAPNDGYTLFLASVSNATNVAITPASATDLAKELTPIALVATVPSILAVHPSLGVANVQELITLAKAKPDQLFFGSVGVGSPPHLAGELFKVMAGVKLVHVPYAGGSGQAATDLIAGRISMVFSPASTIAPHIAAGSVKALAAATAKRAGLFPDLPTIAEAGLPGFDSGVWGGLMAPAGTPRPVIERLARAADEALKTPEVQSVLRNAGIDPLGGTPKDFAELIQAEIEKWTKVAKAAGLSK
jgi:tripartite-type tricarboxylate transporter receptor subunit TctC